MSNIISTSEKGLKTIEGGLWWPLAGLERGMIDWLSKVRLG